MRRRVEAQLAHDERQHRTRECAPQNHTDERQTDGQSHQEPVLTVADS